MTTKIAKTALKSLDTDRYTATQIEVWPNGLGINFKFRGASWEILCDQDLRRIEIARRTLGCNVPSHIYKLHDYATAPNNVEGLIELACLLWIDRRHDFETV